MQALCAIKNMEMKKENIRKLPGSENEVYLWIEQESSIMVKAVNPYGDPVELSSQEVRNFAKLLNEAANELDRLVII